MNKLAEIIAAGGAADANLARRILDPLTEHDGLLRYLEAISFERVRYLQPLVRDARADALPRAARRLEELPRAADLERWYRTTKAALHDRPNEELSRVLVALAMDTLRGRLEKPRVTIDAFVVALTDAGHSPQLVAGGVKRAWAKCKTKPSIAAFLALCGEHRCEVQAAHESICRTLGLRRDAEKVVEASGHAFQPHDARAQFLS